MEEYYPSEIARLVLGYLKEVECHHAWKTFVQESFDLREYYNLYKEGKVYTTNVNGKSLIDTLREYCSFKSNASNRNIQNNCPNNAFQNNEVETSPKIIENTKFVNQMVQTSSSTPACQTPKRKSKCRVTQLNFDNETECMDKSRPNDDVSVDELSCSNSAPNSLFNTDCVITDNTLSKSVMTISVKLCDTSVQTDLNFNYKDQNASSTGIQTENLCFCSPSLSKNFQETFQTNTKQTSCSVSDTNEINMHISSSPELSKSASYSEQNNHDSGTVNVYDKVEGSFSSSNNKSLLEISNCGKGIESEAVLTDEMSSSPVLEKLDDKASYRKEIFPKKVGNSPVSNRIHQTVTATVDILENNMDVTDEDATEDNLILPAEVRTFQKNSYNSNQKTAKISPDRCNEKNVVLTENSTDIQNQSITSEPDNHLNVNIEATEFPKEASNPLEGNGLPGQENLSLENNADGFESNVDNQEITKSSYSDSQLNNSDVSTTSSSKLGVVNNELENRTYKKLTTYSEKCQDSNSSELEKNQPDVESVKCSIPSSLTNADKICADLPGNVEAQKDSKYSNLTEYENKANNKCLSDVSPEKSKTDTVPENDFSIVNTTKEVTTIDVKNKSQVKNVNSEICQSSDNNNQNTVSKLDKSEKISVNDQTISTVAPPLIFNKPSSSVLTLNPSISTYQSVSSGSFIQNNGQYQYFMILPMQTVPAAPTVPVNVINPLLPSPATVLTNVNNLKGEKDKKVAIASSNSDKISSTVSTSSNQNIVVPSPIISCSKDSDKIPSTDKTPCKQNIVVPSPIRSSSKSDKNSDKIPPTDKTPSKQNIVVPSSTRSSSKSDKNSDKIPSTDNTPSEQNVVVPSPIRSSSKSDKRKEKPTAHFITSSPIQVTTSEIQTPSKKRLKGQSECTTCLTFDQNSSPPSKTKTPKKKVKKSKKKKKTKEEVLRESGIPSSLKSTNFLQSKKSKKKKKTKEKDLTGSEIPNKKKSSKAVKKDNKQNVDKTVISSEPPSSLFAEKASLTKNLDCDSILSSFKSPSHSNLSAAFKETSEITDEEGIEKESRVLKVLVSDVLKSSHIQCLDFNVDSRVDKSNKENHNKEICEENDRSQLELQTGKISSESSETGCSLIDKDIKTLKNVTSSCSYKKRVDTFVKEINAAGSILTHLKENSKTNESECPISAPCSALPDIEEFDSSTDIIVKEITTALENCLDDVPDTIEVVVVSDNEEMNKEEEEAVNSQYLTANIGDLPDCQEINQQNLNTELSSVKEAEKIKNHVNLMTTINKAADYENDPAIVDMDCRKLPEALDLGNIEQNNATFQHQEVENITSKNYEKDCEQNLADNMSSTKVGNNNFELSTAASIDLNSERDDLDSTRSLMINTSPINEEENAETLENSFMLSDSESVENDTLSNPVCESNHYSNVNSEELSPLSNSTVTISLHKETQNVPSDINEKIDSSSIHHSPKNHLQLTNSPSFKQNSNVNQILEISTDVENYKPDSCSEKKANLHLPQGIIDSVKYFNSQSKTRKHVNVKNPSNSGLNPVDKITVRSNTSTTFNPTSNSLEVIDTDKCKSVAPCKILSPIVNVETARNENLNSSKIKFVQHLDSSPNKDLNSDIVPYDDVEKAKTLSANHSTKQFSSGLQDMEKFVTDVGSSHLYHSKINYTRTFKKRMRHCSYDSSVSHGKSEALSSGHIMIKSKNSKSLENITDEKLYDQTDFHRKYSSTESVYSHNCELKTSLNQHKITHSNSLSMLSFSSKRDPVSKNSVNCTSDVNIDTEIVLHEDNSQLPAKVQQTDLRKLSAKRYLLEEDSSSDEDSSVIKKKEAIADKFSNKRKLLEKDAHTFQQTGIHSAKKCMLKNDTSFPVRTQKTLSPNVKITNTRLEEVENQANSANESTKCILGRKEPIQSVEQNPVSKNSVNCTSDVNIDTEIVLHEGNSQLPTKVQQTDSHKLSAKRYLLKEDSSSDEDSAVINKKEAIADKFSNKRKLLVKDAPTFQQSGVHSAKICMLKNDTLFPVRTQKTSSPNVKITNTRLEESENQTNSANESTKSILGRKEPIQSVGKRLINDFNQTPSNEVSNTSPKNDGTQTISEIACLDNDKDFPCKHLRYKRKSSDSLPAEECSVDSCSNNRQTLNKSHYVDNQVYENDSNLTKRPKLDSRSNSPEKDNLNDAFDDDSSHLTSNAVSIESSFVTNEYSISKSIVKNIKTDVMKDSPVRCVSYKKKVGNKSALWKILEKDPNMPPGVKIPYKWNTTKIINYSNAIGHSICDNIYSKKNVAKNKRRSRPTLKVATIKSPSKEVLSDKKNISSKLSSLNCLSEGSTQRSIVCNKVLKNEKQQISKKTVKKTRKLDCEQSMKKKSVSIIRAEAMEVQSQVSDKNMLAHISPQNISVVNHCETTQDIVEADIGRSDENGSELANAIASVERELVDLSPDSAPESSEAAIDEEMSAPKSSEAAIDEEMSAVQNSNAISDNCEPEEIKQASLESVSEHSKLLMLLEKIRSMGVDKVLEKIYTLEEENK